jgi:hypothetical protein
MIDKTTAGTIVAGTVGVLFGVMFDADFLQPLRDSVSFKETVPQARYITPFQLGCLAKPQTDVLDLTNNVPDVCIKAVSQILVPQATQ